MTSPGPHPAAAPAPLPGGGTPRAPRGGPAEVHDGWRNTDPWVAQAFALACTALGGLAGHALVGDLLAPPVGAAFGCALVWGVLFWQRSWAPHTAGRLLVLGCALVVLRTGIVHGSLLAGGQVVLAGLVLAVVVLVLADRMATNARPSMADRRPWGSRTTDGAGTGRGEGGIGGQRARLARSTLAVTGVVVLFALVVTPMVLPRMSSSSPIGEGPRLDREQGGAAPLRASDRLDMTTRPELTEEIVFTVQADRGTFWRGQTYDLWDGRTWTRSEPQLLPLGPGDTVVHGSDDLAASGTDRVVQRFRFEAPYAEVVYAAATAVEVDAGRPVAQRRDGTLVVPGAPFGRGGGYTVVSRRQAVDEARLRAADDQAVPDEILRRYASDPETTDRVGAAAREATRGATSTYDRIVALERWIGATTEYSLDAPLSPKGVDVVDHFLFESRLGWCEQIASSLVVLARANNIPARLVTGYVPGELDRLTGTYVVRERDAHAWAEVWFPEVGWVPFDPTADVPLAGADASEGSIGRWLLDHAVAIVLVLAAVGALVASLVAFVRRRRRRRAGRPVGWVAVTEGRLESLGVRVGWPRSDSETATAFARSLGRHLVDDRVEAVGEAIDRALYAPVPPDEHEQARISGLLDDLAEVEPPTPPEVERIPAAQT